MIKYLLQIGGKYYTALNGPAGSEPLIEEVVPDTGETIWDYAVSADQISALNSSIFSNNNVKIVANTATEVAVNVEGSAGVVQTLGAEAISTVTSLGVKSFKVDDDLGTTKTLISFGGSYYAMNNGNRLSSTDSLGDHTDETFPMALVAGEDKEIRLNGNCLPVKLKVNLSGVTSGVTFKLSDVNTGDVIDETTVATNGVTEYTLSEKVYSSTLMLTISSNDNATVESIEMYEQEIGNSWEVVDLVDIATKGMPVSLLDTIQKFQFDEIFQSGLLNYAIYVPSGDNVNSVTVEFVPNQTPILQSYSCDSVHGEAAELKFTLRDLEGKKSYYKLKVGNDYLTGYDSYIDTNDEEQTVTIPNNLLSVGNNTVTLEVKDEDGIVGEYSITIVKTNELPNSIGVVEDNVYKFKVSDEDMDVVTFKATLNGEDVFTCTAPAPYTHELILDKSKILIGQTNTLVITLTDSFGGTKTITETFTGKYIGLLFVDENDECYSTDDGEILKHMNIPTVYAGKTSSPIPIYVVNQSANTLRNVVISCPADLGGSEGIDEFGYPVHITGPVQLGLSSLGSGAAGACVHTIDLMLPYEKKTIYMTVYSSNPKTEGTYVFEVKGKD